MPNSVTNWGPTGETIYNRTYSRPKADGKQETWFETVDRVVKGNIGLVSDKHIEPDEVEKLTSLIREFKILPAGRHLWASGVPGKQFLFNCHVSHWNGSLAEHFEFTFMRLMEGGGVGTNYSSKYLDSYKANRELTVHIVCDPGHPDYEEMKAAEILSKEFDSEWAGAFEVEDSREGWAAALSNLIDTYDREDEVAHADRVYDISRVRAKGTRIKGFGGTASGPSALALMLISTSEIFNKIVTENQGKLTSLTAMEIDHAIAQAVVSGGTRRSARMAIVHWSDPDIFKFINCKRDTGKHWTTNISVEIDNEFVSLVRRTKASKATAERKELADRVLDACISGMLTSGEPGLWNHDLSNVNEPIEVVCTNPCGEISLAPWENCNLGHVNLDAFTGDIEGALEAHRLMARFLTRATFGDVTSEKQADVLAKQRRIGVGHFGFQGWLVKQGIRYSDSHRNPQVRKALTNFRKVTREAAHDYAFELRIPEPVKVTTVAPTGTIAKMPGRTEGVHGIYSRYFIRRVRFNKTRASEAEQLEAFRIQGLHIEQDIYDQSGSTMVVEFPTKELLVEEVEALDLDAEYLVESQDEVALHDMLEVQAMYQTHYADNAVSFTVNIPAEEHQQKALLAGLAVVPEPTSERTSYVRKALIGVLPLLKGTTMMVDGSRPQAPYERITKDEYEALSGGSVDASYDEECASGACPIR